MSKYLVGIDVGGTFTDLVALDRENNRVIVNKTPTTPENQTIGVMRVLEDAGISIADIKRFCHGYTAGINAVLTRNGAKMGLLTTEGFRDELDAGRAWVDREKLYDLSWIRPHILHPIVQRRYRRGIPERIMYDGTVLRPLDENATRKQVQFLKKEGIESVAICFINSYANPSHEQRVKAIVQEIMPGVRVQTSEIRPVPREYERTVTVVLDAYVGPLVERYLTTLESKLREKGYSGDVLIMQMSGGYRKASLAHQRAVYSLQSGPIAGILGSIPYAKLKGSDALVTYDMGGTSTDIGLVLNKQALITNEWTIEHGITILTPIIEVTSIGSGGSSLIYLDKVGTLHVGPESLGAYPGPACYDRGGDRPTLTDAGVVLGYLQPNLFCDGKMKLRVDLADKSLARVAEPLKLSAQELAESSWQMAIAFQAESLKSILSYRELDPKETKLLAFGSAGPMMATGVAKKLGIPEVIIPIYAGCHSAFGTLNSEIRSDRSLPFVKAIDLIGPGGLNEAFRKLEKETREDLLAQGLKKEQLRIERYYYGMYYGQSWDNRVELPLGDYDLSTIEDIKKSFHEWYLKSYGYQAPELPIIVTSIEVNCIGPAEIVNWPKITEGEENPPQKALVGKTDIWRKDGVIRDIPIWRREKLLARNSIIGPAIVDEGLATTFVAEGDKLTVDEHGILTIKVNLSNSKNDN